MWKYIVSVTRGMLIGFGIVSVWVSLVYEVRPYSSTVSYYGKENYSLYRKLDGNYLLVCHGTEDGEVCVDGNFLSLEGARQYLIEKGEMVDYSLEVACCHAALSPRSEKAFPAIEAEWGKDSIYVSETIPGLVLIRRTPMWRMSPAHSPR